MDIDNQLKQIAKSYDRHFIEYGQKDSLAYDNLPDYITSNPDYRYWENEANSDWADHRRAACKDYLSPDQHMNFIQFGCSMNLKTRGYDKWPSKYFGVDISKETISTLYHFIGEKNIPIGSLYCGSAHETPFSDNFFDIGECIGVLEYYESDFILKTIKEFHRILKPNAKFVLDMPNLESPSGKVMTLIEACMGRPDRFDMTSQAFEDMLKDYFEIDDSDWIRAANRGERHMKMVSFYCLRCKK